MDLVSKVKTTIGTLTDIGLMLLALAIVASLLVGGTLPFFGGVVGNITALIKDLGSNGLVGLIALGFIIWLFAKRG
jgi:ABC-type enterochelin transport system permease subunit